MVHFTSSQQVHRPKTRIPTYKMRELSKGNFIVKRGHMDSIGEGGSLLSMEAESVSISVITSRRIWDSIYLISNMLFCIMFNHANLKQKVGRHSRDIDRLLHVASKDTS